MACVMKDRSHNEAVAELFRDDPQFAAEYLNDLLQAVSQRICWLHCARLPMRMVVFAP